MQVEKSSLEYFKDVLTNHYADFNGRARRAEYWHFVLWQVIIMVAALVVSGILGAVIGETGALLGMGVYYLAALAFFIPSLAAVIRRLHDTNRSGWWYLIALVPVVGAIVLLVFLASEGTRGTNNYGPDPKRIADEADVLESFVAN